MNEERVCEYFGCSRLASEVIDTHIGKKENITLNLCKKCSSKFKRTLQSFKEVPL